MDEQMTELVNVTMENIKNLMANENIVGKPIMMPEGSVVIPISKVTLAFVTGGGNYGENTSKAVIGLPFAGGGGGGVSITPIGFLVSDNGDNNLIKLDKKEGENKWQALFQAAMNVLKDKK